MIESRVRTRAFDPHEERSLPPSRVARGLPERRLVPAAGDHDVRLKRLERPADAAVEHEPAPTSRHAGSRQRLAVERHLVLQRGGKANYQHTHHTQFDTLSLRKRVEQGNTERCGDLGHDRHAGRARCLRAVDQVRDARRDALDRVFTLHELAGVAADLRPAVRVVCERAECRGERGRIAWRHEDAGVGAVEDLDHARDCARDDGPAERHRLEQDEGCAFVPRRHCHDVHAAQELVGVCAALSQLDATARCEAPHVGGVVGERTYRPCDNELEFAPRAHEWCGVEQHVDSFLRVDAAEQANPDRLAGPRRRGVGDTDAVWDDAHARGGCAERAHVVCDVLRDADHEPRRAKGAAVERCLGRAHESLRAQVRVDVTVDDVRPTGACGGRRPKNLARDRRMRVQHVVVGEQGCRLLHCQRTAQVRQIDKMGCRVQRAEGVERPPVRRDHHPELVAALRELGRHVSCHALPAAGVRVEQ